jgi:predicted alpha/beta-hydrolase family hydrolase
MHHTEAIKIPVSEKQLVSGEIIMPEGAEAILVLAHGAGADMRHVFMERLAHELALQHIATLRYNFPYIEQKKKRPDFPPVAHATVKAALLKANILFPQLPVIAGGKSFGGRMTSQYVAKEHPEFLKGIVFYGFPLHPAGAPSIDRADHLKDVKIPMLFLQGTNDKLAEIKLIEGVCGGLPDSMLTFYEKADHSFKSGKQDLIPDLALKTLLWFNKIC